MIVEADHFLKGCRQLRDQQLVCEAPKLVVQPTNHDVTALSFESTLVSWGAFYCFIRTFPLTSSVE